MALLNSLYAGVSGLSNHQSMLDVIGNNIANVNTIGYKGSRVTFSDTFNQLIQSGTNPTSTSGGTNSFQIGLGTKVSSIDRNWSQGTFEGTSTTTDLALQGDGMFVLKSNGQQLYSRAGNFIFDADGKLVSSSNGAVVQGKVANGAGVIPAGTTLQDIVIDTNLRLPAVKTSEISWSGNLDSSSGTIRTDIVELDGNLKKDTSTSTYPGAAYSASDTDTYEASTIYDKNGDAYQLRNYYTENAGAWTYNYEIYAMDSDGEPTGASLSSGSQLLAFDATTGACTTTALNIENTTENISYELNFGSLSNLNADTNAISKVDQGEELATVEGSVTIYDSLGNAHVLSLEFEHIDSNTWSWKASVPEASGTLNSDSYGEIIFDSTGSIQSISQGGSLITSSPAVPEINFTPSSGAEQQSITLDFGEGTSGITQTNLSSQIAATDQNGSASATLSDIDIDTYGNITGIFSNGNSRVLAQVMVATFTNLNGLVSVGDNMYNVAANSGEPLISEPGETSGTTIQSSSLEQSNVDLSEEFTKMIVAQRGFQANSRVITTSDTLLQEITNLIR
jgi:flagellar hook protein FlgE